MREWLLDWGVPAGLFTLATVCILLLLVKVYPTENYRPPEPPSIVYHE